MIKEGTAMKELAQPVIPFKVEATEERLTATQVWFQPRSLYGSLHHARWNDYMDRAGKTSEGGSIIA